MAGKLSVVRTPALADLICERLASGRSLLSICGDADAPLAQSVAVQFISPTATAAEAAEVYQRLLA